MDEKIVTGLVQNFTEPEFHKEKSTLQQIL